MHEYKKCAFPHLCFFSSICPKWRVDNKCVLDKNRVEYTHTDIVGFKTHEMDRETPFARQQAWIWESYGVSDGEEQA
jgi:hypothetical protein